MRLVVALALALAACRAAPRSAPAWPDTPFELRDDADRAHAIDQLWTMSLGPAHDQARARIARALAERIADALAEDRPHAVELQLFQLVSLWQRDPSAIRAGMAEYAGLVRTLRATFARSGALEPTVATLALLAEIDAERRDAHLAELDEVLRFSDELAAAEDGPESTRAQPIRLLQPTALALPLPWLVDRYVSLLVQRQRAVSSQINQHGASVQLVRAHRDILATSQRIAVALSRAGRPGELHRHLTHIQGLGASRELAIRAELLAEHPTADAYQRLADAIRGDRDNPDPAAALGVCQLGLARFPRHPGLLATAASAAAALGRVAQPIALYEAAIAADERRVDSAFALRLGTLYAERIARLAFGGRPTAATRQWRELDRVARALEGRPDQRVWSVVAANAETALGKGLLSQGQLGAAERALVASLERAPSFDAYETLATIHYKTDRLASAIRYATAGIALLGDTSADRARRARLDRIAGDVARAAGHARESAALYVDALRAWAELGADDALAPALRAERKLEAGRLLWFLGDPGKAVNLVFDAIDSAPASADNYGRAVAFLLAVDAYADAVDIVHRALSQTEVTDFHKVYMCLWITAEARRRGAPRDRQATAFLSSRQGGLWHELLAQAATGRVELAALRAAAVTTPRQAELAFYEATLGLAPRASVPDASRRLLRQVVDAKLIMDAEYDLARRYLAGP